MHKTLLLLPLLAFPARVRAQSALACDAALPGARTVKVSIMHAVKRDRAWAEGGQKSVVQTVCDSRGMKVSEAEYDAKALRVKTGYEYVEPAEAKALCEKLKSEERQTTSFSGEAQSSLDEFCRKNRKKEFSAVFVYDLSPSNSDPLRTQDSAGAKKPVRQIFRLYNPKGFVTEEHYFDPGMNLETRFAFSYDKGNNLVESSEYDMEGRQLARETVERSRKTASRTRMFYGESGELKRKILYEDSETGALRRETRTDFDAGEQIISRREFYCDAKGRYEKEYYYDGDSPDPSKEFTYEYEADAKGNWTLEKKTRTILYKGSRIADTQYAPEITRREIQYY